MDRTLRLFVGSLLLLAGLRLTVGEPPAGFLIAVIPAPSNAHDPVVKDNSSDVPYGKLLSRHCAEIEALLTGQDAWITLRPCAKP